MASLYLSRLSADDRKALIKKLHETQHGHCFICEEPIDLVLQKDSIDIDHVIPLTNAGKDDSSNFVLTHASCNRSKQASNLEVARVLRRFERLKEAVAPENRSANLGDVLKAAGGGDKELAFKLEENSISYALNGTGDVRVHRVPVYVDELSGFRYFFAKLPIQYLAHDDRINPRSIGANIGKLVEEFHQKRPQLHVPLAWVSSTIAAHARGSQPSPASS